MLSQSECKNLMVDKMQNVEDRGQQSQAVSYWGQDKRKHVPLYMCFYVFSSSWFYLNIISEVASTKVKEVKLSTKELSS